jgi:hypothetical protein
VGCNSERIRTIFYSFIDFLLDYHKEGKLNFLDDVSSNQNLVSEGLFDSYLQIGIY